MRAVNLLPRDDSRRRRKRLTVVVQLALLSPFVVGSLLVAGYLLASSKVSDNKATLRALQDELATLPPPSAESKSNSALAGQRDQRIVALSSALQNRVAWDRVLREISSVLPDDVWLKTLSAEPPPAPAAAPPPPTTTETTTTETQSSETTTTTPAPPSGAPLTLDGFTYSQEGVARFLSRLAVIPELQDVKLIKSIQPPGQIAFEFVIQATVPSQAAA